MMLSTGTVYHKDLHHNANAAGASTIAIHTARIEHTKIPECSVQRWWYTVAIIFVRRCVIRVVRETPK